MIGLRADRGLAECVQRFPLAISIQDIQTAKYSGVAALLLAFRESLPSSRGGFANAAFPAPIRGHTSIMAVFPIAFMYLDIPQVQSMLCCLT